ncbi:hypothetical protein GP486_005966 [Trichoglossum hirsutum]|uniref:Uncharacterized protein n=1 Tax=Trichoglossum hirsutum TaxID=265104 RepID=A0A9P8L884_9PEZI|nr:hypothetical protein GP486_005966 [Trichoglossum hirsutum]
MSSPGATINVQGEEGGSDATGPGDITLDMTGEKVKPAENAVGAAAAAEVAGAGQGTAPVLTLQSSFSDVSQSTLADTIEMDLTPPTSSDGPLSQGQNSQQPQQSQFCGQPRSFQQPNKPTLEIQPPRTPTMKSADLVPSPSPSSTQQICAHGQQVSPKTQRPSTTFKGLGLGISAGAGQKRTASGAIKPASASGPTSPMDAVGLEALRESSTSSAGAHRIGEMGAQLKARLSYALIKVQNGWQSRTLDEVESIYAHQISPISPSTSSVFHGGRKPLTTSTSSSPSSSLSPRAAFAKHKREKSITQGGNREHTTSPSRADFELGITSPSSGLRRAVRVNNDNNINNSYSSSSSNMMNGKGCRVTNGASSSSAAAAAEVLKQQVSGGGSTTSSTPSSSMERTYESFWRDHSSNPVTAKIVQARAAAVSGTGGSPAAVVTSLSGSLPDNNPRITGLAPPANIIPSRNNPRRTTQPQRAPPPLIPIQTLSNLSNSSFLSVSSSGSTIPNTPPQQRGQQHQHQHQQQQPVSVGEEGGTTPTPTPTPTQQSKTAMEQDAVETLMFMSSPGNSQQHPSGAAPRQQQQQQQQQQEQQQHLRAPNTTATTTGTALPSPHFISPSQAPLQNGTSGRHKRRKSATAITTKGVVLRRSDHDLGDDEDLTDDDNDNDGEEEDDEDDDDAIILPSSGGGGGGGGSGGDALVKGYVPPPPPPPLPLMEGNTDGDELDRMLDGMGSGGVGSGSSTEGEG